MIQGVDQWECRSTVQSPSIIECRRNAHRCFVGIEDAEVDLPHFTIARLSIYDLGPRRPF